jgi:phosphohistidine phosphatase
MELYILRHGIAVPRGTPGYPDDDRPLTEEGVEKMKAGAKGIAQVVSGFDVIISSPLVRALDTAKITAKAAAYKNEIVITEFLIPGTPMKTLLKFLEGYKDKERVLIAGHEPQLGFIASNLIGAEDSVIMFKKGGICRIDITSLTSGEKGTLVWSMTPKQLRLLAK